MSQAGDVPMAQETMNQASDLPAPAGDVPMPQGAHALAGEFAEKLNLHGPADAAPAAGGQQPTASSSSSASAPPAENGGAPKKKKPTVIINIGMAGSGKTTMMHQMCLFLLSQKKRIYAVNMDPAVKNVNYPCAIDTRDTINYKEVMSQFKLGPNGAIMTSLNLFATRFDQVLELIDKRAGELDYVLIDTPGQIEVFSWSASGSIICDALAVEYPTVINYVVDTVRCVRPVTFMSNMLYACSILYKTKLPFVVSFNKIDVMNCDFVRTWLNDYKSFAEALEKDEKTYLACLSKSMARTLEEFYCELNNCGVSAATGDGFEEFMECVGRAELEYETDYRSFLAEQQEAIKQKREKLVDDRMRDFERNLDKSKAHENDLFAREGVVENEAAAAAEMEMDLEEEDC